VRVMPNTPLLVGQGAAAYCLGSAATAEDEAIVRRMLGASGSICQVKKESKMDAVRLGHQQHGQPLASMNAIDPGNLITCHL